MKVHTTVVRGIVVILAVFASLPMAAQVQAGDVVVSAAERLLTGTQDTIEAFSPTGFLHAKVYDGGGDVLIDPNGTLWAILAGGLTVHNYSPALLSLSAFGTGGALPAALAMTADRSLLVGMNVGPVVKFATNGAQLDSFPVAVTAGQRLLSMDLALDGCTLYYVSGTKLAVRRYDTCTRQQLADALTTTTICDQASVRVGANGSVFVAGCSTIYVISGSNLMSYPAPAGHLSTALNPTADASELWSVDSTAMMRLNAANGAVLAGPFPLTGLASPSLALYPQPRAVVVAAAAAIPAVSRLVLGCLAAALGVLAWIRLRV